MYEGLPHGVLAYGWIPFLVVTILSLLFSIVYVLWYRSTRAEDRAPGTWTVAILGLFLTLLATVLVPVDVFLISYMKNKDGTWKDWSADPEARESIKNMITYCYYLFYSLIISFCFLIIPANFFYHGVASTGEDEEEPPVSAKLCQSLKYTLLSLFLFSIIVITGIFIPFNGKPPGNETSWEKFEWFFDELEANKGQDLLVFILNIINIIGMMLLIFYTGYGLSSLPCGLIWARRSVDAQQTSIERTLEEIEKQIGEIRGRHRGGNPPRFEQSQIDRLEQQARLLRREQRDVEQSARNALNRCLLCLKPFQVVFGLLFSVLGFLIFLSLLLTNIDKAINSGGPFTGYTLQNSSLPNPLDLLLILSQSAFPLDYILYTILILFLFFCSMSGIRNVGIRFCWVRLYQVRAWRTPPRGLLLAVLSSMYMITATSVLMFSLVPDYTMFGDQYYRTNSTVGNTTTLVVERCGATTFPQQEDNCLPSRIATLLLSFHYKAWIFGAAYYWLTWLLLLSVCFGSGLTLFRLRKPLTLDEDQESLLDSADQRPDPFVN